MTRDAVLSPLKAQPKLKQIAAFDTETSDRNLRFELGCISWGPEPGIWIDPEQHEFHYSRDTLLRAMQGRRARESMLWASNMEFDFFTASDGTVPRGWELFHNGSKFMYAHFYTQVRCSECSGNGCATPNCPACRKPWCSKKSCAHGIQKVRRVSLYDSFNIYRLSVEEMGFILRKVSEHAERKGDELKSAYFNVGKLKKPEKLGQITLEEMTERQAAYFHEYNLFDAIVTRKFVEYMQEEFSDLGSGLKATTPGIAMQIWRSQHLRETYKKPHRAMNANARASYFGGRTEVIRFGLAKDLHAYDFKSMYPWAMKNCRFPNPNSLEYIPKPDKSVLLKEGVTRAVVTVPTDQYIPCLPTRSEELGGKVIFPIGTFRGTWTNLELRYALQQGCTIDAIEWTIISEDSCQPFESFINDLWASRARDLRDENPADIIKKLAMNALYGKFGMNEDKDGVYHYLSIHDANAEELYDYTTAINPALPNRGVLLQPIKEKPDFAFVNVFWATYVTARARTNLHAHLIRAARSGARIYYMDTDSMYVDRPLSFAVPDENANLGDLAFKGFYPEAVFIAPKFYVLKNAREVAEKKLAKARKKGNDHAKLEDFEHEYFAKGLPGEPRKQMISKLATGTLSFTYQKFLRFKESARREGSKPNEIVPAEKTFEPLARPKRRLVEPVKNVREFLSASHDSVPWEAGKIPNTVIQE